MPVSTTQDINTSTSPARRFVYKWRGLWVVSSLLISLMMIGLSAVTFQPDEGWDIATRLMILTFAVFLSCAFLISIFMRSDVVLNDHDISWSLMGKTWKRIKWQDVTKINVYSLPTIGFVTRYHTCISIECAAKPLFYRRNTHGLSFNDTIQRFPELLALVNRYVDLYRIDIVDHRTGAVVHPPRL